MTQFSNQSAKRLYSLLPAIYQVRDIAQGQTLEALLEIVEREIQFLESDMDGLYENWFIETCAQWVVPYIGDLLNVKEISVQHNSDYGQQEQRAYVANTLNYRRRKGTLPILEQLVQDITGWRGRAVEFFQLLATTQNLNHERPNNTTVSLQGNKKPNQLGTPFETQAAYTAEIRNINSQNNRGRYNISNIGLFIWRLQSYPLQYSRARLVNLPEIKPSQRHYTFSPLGEDIPLFNLSRTDTDIIRLTEEIELPTALRPELKDRFYQKPISDQSYFGTNPVFQIFIQKQSQLVPIPAQQILITNLGKDAEKEDWQISANQPLTFNDDTNYLVAVDPKLGRLLFLTSTPAQVIVNYAYGFSGDVGGVHYNRTQSITTAISSTVNQILWTVDPARAKTQTQHPNIFSTCSQAVHKWNTTVKIWEYCQQEIFIILQTLTVSTENFLNFQSHPPKVNRFQPGIISGLKVIAKTTSTEVTVTSGIAIDGQGRKLELKINYPVHLPPAKLGNIENQNLWLVLVSTNVNNWEQCQIQVVADADVDSTDREQIRIAHLIVNFSGQILEAQTNISPQFQPGVIEGLKVTRTSVTQLAVSHGAAVNSQGEKIILENPQSFDLSLDSGKTLNIFIAPQASQDWKQVDVVPETNIGAIVIKSNLTYHENIHLLIPADKHLYLIAANENRPHFWGNITITGMASHQSNPGELTIDGLLIEGEIKVNPGNLKHLSVNHCTIVPHQGQIVVEPQPAAVSPPVELSQSLTFIAIVMYWLSFIRKLIRLGTDTTLFSPAQNLYQIKQLTWQIIQHLYSLCHQGIETREEVEKEVEEEIEITTSCLDNSNLTVSIYRTITGSINLADTVPNLEIVDSIIDQGGKNQIIFTKDGLLKRPPDAISAANTNADIHTSTILGSTKVRSLEASNSIFSDLVFTLRQQIGCVRFSYIFPGSNTPRRYLCQPDRVLTPSVPQLPPAITALAIPRGNNLIFAGTAGQGIFRWDTTAEAKSWIPGGLSNLNITALTTDGTKIFAGTSKGMVFVSEDNGKNWRRIGSENNSPIGLVAGKQTTGTLTSTGIIVQGQNTLWKTELQLGDRITVANQSRTVIDIDSDTQLVINAPFQPDLTSNTTFSVNIGINNSAITALLIVHTHEYHSLFAATAGSGIFRSQNQGESWEFLSNGLTQLDITSLATTSQGQIFAGTVGNGIFTSPENGQSWYPVNVGLSCLDVSALTTVDQEVFAGTTKGGIYRWNRDGMFWCAMNTGLTHNHITVLGGYSQVVFAGTLGGGIFCSIDNGNSWTEMETSEFSKNITSLVIQEESNQPKQVWIGTAIGDICVYVETPDVDKVWKSMNQDFNNLQNAINIYSRLQPSFTSIQYGQPGYAQLSSACPEEINTGAEDGSEMGVFSYLKQPQKQANLQNSLQEYLRFGLEAGIFFVN